MPPRRATPARDAGIPRHDVPLAGGRATTASVYTATEARHALLVLAHGAGAGQQHPFMTDVASGLAARGIDVVTFDFPYIHERRKVPDRAPVLEAAFGAVVEWALAQPALARRRLLIGGKSMGGRMATHLAAAGFAPAAGPPLGGVVAFGYPLHPPGKPEQLRTAHLPAIAVPVLIVQGSRDTFGTPQELAAPVASMRAPVSLHVVDGGDHSLVVARTPRERVLGGVLDAVAAWTVSSNL